MNRHKGRLVALILVIIIVIGWCITIFNLSNMNSADSNDASTGIVEKLIMKILSITNEYEITHTYPDPQALSRAAEIINAPLRKIIHATVYCVLALLLLLISRIVFGSRKYLLSCAIVIVLCAIFAITDEYHQTYIDGRTGQPLDVFIDIAGACIGTMFFSSYYVAWWFGNKSNNIDHQNNS